MQAKLERCVVAWGWIPFDSNLKQESSDDTQTKMDLLGSAGPADVDISAAKLEHYPIALPIFND